MQKSCFKITSLQNTKVKEAIRLRDRRERDQTDRFLIEGYRELKRALDANKTIETLFFCPTLFLGTNEWDLCERSGAELIECSEAVFEKLSYRDRPDGLLAIAPQQHRTLEELLTLLSNSKTPFLVIAESIEKPGNLGTILRSADAAGVDAVIVCDPTTDIYNPNVVRSSVGTLFTVPIFELEAGEALTLLKGRNIAIAAATPSAKATFTEVDLTIGVAIAVGTEQYGLSQMWMNQADLHVRIPMFGIADSLNVASATTLVLYEVVRQRKRS